MSCQSFLHAATSMKNRDVVKSFKCSGKKSKLERCFCDLCRAAVTPVMIQLQEHSLSAQHSYVQVSITGQSRAMLAQHFELIHGQSPHNKTADPATIPERHIIPSSQAHACLEHATCKGVLLTCICMCRTRQRTIATRAGMLDDYMWTCSQALRLSGLIWRSASWLMVHRGCWALAHVGWCIRSATLQCNTMQNVL